MLVKMTGILLAKPAREFMLADQAQWPAEAKPLASNDLHITLCRLPKAIREQLKGREFEPIPEVRFEEEIRVIERPAQKRKAWVVFVAEEGQLLLRQYVDSLNLLLDSYECTRPFHVSLANLTGSPFESVGDVTQEERLGKKAA